MSLLRSSSTARIASAKSFRNVFVSCPGVSRARAVRVAALNHKEPSPQPSAMLAEAKTQLDRFFQVSICLCRCSRSACQGGPPATMQAMPRML